MSDMLNPEHFNAPSLNFKDLPEGMGEKVEVGDMIIAKEGEQETSAEVIDIDKAGGCIYLSKELPKDANYTIKETSTGSAAPYEAMRKHAALDESKEPSVADMPLPDLKKLIISISIEQGE